MHFLTSARGIQPDFRLNDANFANCAPILTLLTTFQQPNPQFRAIFDQSGAICALFAIFRPKSDILIVLGHFLCFVAHFWRFLTFFTNSPPSGRFGEKVRKNVQNGEKSVKN